MQIKGALQKQLVQGGRAAWGSMRLALLPQTAQNLVKKKGKCVANIVCVAVRAAFLLQRSGHLSPDRGVSSFPVACYVCCLACQVYQSGKQV